LLPSLTFGTLAVAGCEINELLSVAAEGEAPITGGFFKIQKGTGNTKYGPYKVSGLYGPRGVRNMKVV
jgi:hypothetical protein